MAEGEENEHAQPQQHSAAATLQSMHRARTAQSDLECARKAATKLATAYRGRVASVVFEVMRKEKIGAATQFYALFGTFDPQKCKFTRMQWKIIQNHSCSDRILVNCEHRQV